jgi:N-acetyl-alpha-D-glucosaminyl L-malate synthase BshA
MKIGITCHTSAGGSGILATELGIAMAQRGHEVHFVTYDVPFRLREFQENIVCHQVEPVSYPLFKYPPFSLALTTKIYEVARENQIDIWHAHYAIPNAVSAMHARAMLPEDRQFKIVTTLHGTDITLVGSDPSFYSLTRFAMEKSCAVTAVSQWLTEETRQTFDLDRPVRTIYNFLNEDRFERKPEDRARLADPHERILMHISNFRPVKRVTDVVRVFRKVADRTPARLVMVGDGPERMSALGVARQLGITDRIKWLGTYESIESVLPFADLVIQPSEHESFGLVALEAMAAEVPVVGTASGGICEVVRDGETGYLCEVGDTDAMAERALSLLNDREAAAAMGRRGREVAVANFSRDHIVAQYEALYRELLTGCDNEAEAVAAN